MKRIENGVKANEKRGVAIGTSQKKGDDKRVAKRPKPHKGLSVVNAGADDEYAGDGHQTKGKYNQG